MVELKREVVIIPATGLLTKNMKSRNLKVAAYCRVSTDSEEQLNSFDSQKAYYTNLIKSNKNWQYVDTFADEGISGVTAEKRPDFMRMISMCEKSKIDLIITKSISRFSRNLIDSISYTRKLKARGIGVIFEKENINSLEETSELIMTILAALAQEEIVSLSKNIKLGKRMAMKAGKVYLNYKQLYAYEKGDDGNAKIIPKEAEIIKKIFTSYLIGKSTGEIAKLLNEEKVPSPTNKTWGSTTIRNILKNEVYCGDVVLQKTFISDPISKKVVINTGQLAKYHIKNNHIGIIPREMFEAVIYEHSKRNKHFIKDKNNNINFKKYSGKHDLNGLIICSDCKSNYRRVVWTLAGGVKKPVWRCSTRIDKGVKYCNTSPTLDERLLYITVQESINSITKNKERTLQYFTQELKKTLESKENNKIDTIKVQEEIQHLTNQTMEYISQMADTLNLEEYKMKIENISKEIAGLKKILEKAKQEKENADTEYKMQEVYKEITKQKSAETEGVILRQLIKNIEVINSNTIKIIYHSGEVDIRNLREKRNKVS